MRHYSDLRASQNRFGRLFELQRQKDVQSKREVTDARDTLRLDIALQLRDRAIRSLRTPQPSDPR